MGQNVIAPAYALALVGLWLELRHDPHGPYAQKLVEIEDYERTRLIDSPRATSSHRRQSTTPDTPSSHRRQLPELRRTLQPANIRAISGRHPSSQSHPEATTPT